MKNQIQTAYIEAREEVRSLNEKLKTALGSLQAAEEALIEWGLSKSPPKEAASLKKMINTATIYRINVLKQFMERKD